MGSPMVRYEYRVRWLRVGGDVKTKVYQDLRAARNRVALMGPEPWTAFGHDPEALMCCPGTRQYECGCGGITWREHYLSKRTTAESEAAHEYRIPPLMFAEIQRRRVMEWESMPNAQPATSEGGPR